MPTSVLITVALSVLLGILVIFLPTGGTETSAATTADHALINAQTVAGGTHAGFSLVRWNINRGSSGYLTMLEQLQNLAEMSADNASTRGFADIVISCDSDTPGVHAVIRLSDFSVVRFLSSDTSYGFALDLSPDVPRTDDVPHDDWFIGKDGFDALARVANQSLTAVNLSETSLENSLTDLGSRDTDRTAQALGMLRYLIAIKASRFRPVATRIATGMDNGSDVFLTAQQAGVMRDEALPGRSRDF